MMWRLADLIMYRWGILGDLGDFQDLTVMTACFWFIVIAFLFHWLAIVLRERGNVYHELALGAKKLFFWFALVGFIFILLYDAMATRLWVNMMTQEDYDFYLYDIEAWNSCIHHISETDFNACYDEKIDSYFQ